MDLTLFLLRVVIDKGGDGDRLVSSAAIGVSYRVLGGVEFALDFNAGDRYDFVRGKSLEHLSINVCLRLSRITELDEGL